MTASEWKEFYRREREVMREDEIVSLFARDAKLPPPNRGGALIFPHTKLRDSGQFTAAVAQAVVESRCDSVLALGVLHGRPRDNPKQRRIHGPEVMNDEFSLDNFIALVEFCARQHRIAAPKIISRFPFMTGESPETLDGFDELRNLIDRGAMLVATTDPVHHGAGYDTPIDQQLPREAKPTAKQWIEEALEALHRRDYRAFLENAALAKSDFRDVGPVLAELIDMPAKRSEIVDLELVDYAETLQSPPPTWVAAALITIG